MKPRILSCSIALLALLSTARSAVFTWDITPGTVGSGDSAITGGTGTWNLADGNWTSDAGVTNVLWGNTNVDEAIFGGTPGTVTINTGPGVTANRLTFNVDGYVVNGNVAADVLTLAGTTPAFAVTTAGHTATINAIVAGTAGITKSGAGTLVLNGANTYTGNTILSGGTLVVGHVDALSTQVTGSGGSNLRLATDTSVAAFSVNTVSGSSFTITSDRATAGAAITHVLGTAALGGGSSTVTFAQGSNVTSGTAGVSLASLSLSAGITAGGSQTTILNPTTATVTILGNVTRTGATTGSTKVLTLSGTIAGNAINGTINNLDADDIIRVTKQNTSTWTLNSTNSNYTGITTITAGVLEVAGLANGGANSSIGASTNAATNLVFGASGATLRYIGSANVSTDRGFTTSSGAGGGATIESAGTGTLTLDNTVAIAYGTTNETRTLTLGGSNTGANTFTKTLADNGTGATSLTKNGAGTWVLDGTVANTHTGTTAINGGTLILAKTAGVNAIGGNVTIGNAGVGLDILQLNNSDQIADTAVATFNGAGADAGILRLNNQNETLAGLTSAGGAGIVENGNASAGASTLTLNFATGTQTFSGILRDHDGTGTGILNVTKSGAGGNLTLTGTNTYTGVTTINGGGVIAATLLANGGTGSSIGASTNAASNLVFGAPAAILRYTGSSHVTTDRSFTTSSGAGGGATIQSSGTGTLSFDNTVPIAYGTTAETRALTLGGTNTGLNTFSKTISNNGGSATSLTKADAGRWTLDTANSYSGQTTIGGGALRITHGSALGTTGGNTSIGNAAVLELAGGISTNEPIATNGAGSAGAADRLVNVSGSNTLGGNITNGTGGNHYGFRSDSGTLTINGNITFPNSSTRTLYLRGDGDGVINGTISPGGTAVIPVIKEGNGTWTLVGNKAYNGDTTISGGTLQIGNGGTTGGLSATTAIVNNANLTINRSNAFSQATDLGAGVAITGAGSFTQAGSGTTTLTANNTYTGPTNVTAGTLEIGGLSGNLSGTLSVNVTGGTLLLSGGSERINDSASLTLGAGGRLIFADALSSTTESLGSLILAANGIIDFGTGSGDRLILSGGISGLGAYTLSIYNWTGPVGDPAQDVLAYGSTLSVAELSNISFYSGAIGTEGTTFLGTGTDIAFGTPSLQIVPIPEPSSTALLGTVGLVGLIGCRERRHLGRRSRIAR